VLNFSPPRDGFSLLAHESVDIVPKEPSSQQELDSDASALMVDELPDGLFDEGRKSAVFEEAWRESRGTRFSRPAFSEPPSDASGRSSAAQDVFGAVSRNFHIVVEGKPKSSHISGACMSSRNATMSISMYGGEPPGETSSDCCAEALMSSWDDTLNPT